MKEKDGESKGAFAIREALDLRPYPGCLGGIVWVKMPIWRGDIPTKSGGNALAISLHCPLKDFLPTTGSELQDVGTLGGRGSVPNPSF